MVCCVAGCFCVACFNEIKYKVTFIGFKGALTSCPWCMHSANRHNVNVKPRF